MLPRFDPLNVNTFVLLVAISLVLGIVSLIRPAWPLLGVAVILVCVALLIGKT